MLTGQDKIFILRHFLAHIDHTSWADKLARRNCICGVIGAVLAGDPMNRGVEVGAGMFTQVKGVPIPGGTLIIVTRNDFHRDAG